MHEPTPADFLPAAARNVYIPHGGGPERPVAAGAARRWWPGLIGLWLATCAWLLAGRAQAIRSMRMPDSDDAMRLLQVRGWLGGQGWFDLRQYRLDPPAGADIHWTRLVDLPLAAIVAPLRPWLGGAMAETIAASMVPLLALLAAMVLLARLGRRLIAPAAWWWPPLLLLAASPALDMMAPLRIDHHGWQIVLVLAMLMGLVTADRRRGGLLAGLAIAGSLAIGVEMLPYLAMGIGVAALGWLIDPHEGARLHRLCGAAAAGVFAGLFAFVPQGQRLGGACDALSAAYALPLWAGCAVLAAAAAGRFGRKGRHPPLAGPAPKDGSAADFDQGCREADRSKTGGAEAIRHLSHDRASTAWGALAGPGRDARYPGGPIRTGDPADGRRVRAGWIAAAGLAAGAALLAGGGGVCLIDPYHAVDPAARALWLDRVSEALPLWRQGAEVFWASLAMPLTGLAGAIMMWRRGPQRGWGVMLAMAALSIVLALVSTRAAVVAQALALPGAAALGHHGRAWLAARRSMAMRVFGSVALFLGVSAIAPRLLIAAVAGAPPDRTAAAAEAGDVACMAPRALAALDALPPATLLATIDATPALLLHTHHRGLAGPYHRNGRAIADTMRAWAGAPAMAEAIVRRHAIAYLIACGEPAEAQLYDRRAPDGLHARLMRGAPPVWLARVRVAGTPWRVWRVRRAGAG